jgi:D-beta-D-heptose 7-phosphate kinase/D-beta-D-heptose 1-phosphate adenosyltransferase
MKIVLVTGGFDPLHGGHIAYFKSARTLGDMLIVGLNSDEWLERKKGRAFMPWNERLCIINNLSMIDEVYTFDDSDGSAKNFIRQVRSHYPDAELIFANGGDRNSSNIPEMDVVDSNLKFEFAVGGENKKNSSSWILEEWKTPKTTRPWGWYRILEDSKTYKVKELVINPGGSLSMQRHFKRSEHWYVLKGQCNIKTVHNNVEMTVPLLSNTSYVIDTMVWHQGINNTNVPCHILEVQYGEICVEEDIERQ